MVLQSVRSIEESGNLVAEVYHNDRFLALLSKGGIRLQNKGYSLAPTSPVDLKTSEFAAVWAAATNWQRSRHELWGRRYDGDADCGHVSLAYFRPNSYHAHVVPVGQSPEEAGIEDVGKLQQTVVEGDLEFVLERFSFGIRRGDQQAVFTEQQVELIRDALFLCSAREQLYHPAEELDRGRYVS